MTENSSLKIGGILLAAGGSSRLGQPKQLLNFNGKSLIRRAAETLLESECEPIVVVLGAEIEGSIAELAGFEVNVCVNENWHEGMSTSIVAGLNLMLTIAPDLDGVVITLCDQPHVTSADIDKLVAEFAGSPSPIIAAKYGETRGVPALFSSRIFHRLLLLEGDKGARELIDSVNANSVEIAKAAIDIDTLDDVKRSASIENIQN